MAVTEFWASRQESISIFQHQIIAIYTATWSDWFTNFVDLPSIGDLWDATRPDLRCNHIGAKAIDNVNMRATATFSTASSEDRHQREDQVFSWEEGVEVQVEEQEITTWTGPVTETDFTWAEEWESDSAGRTAENRPALIKLTPRSIVTITTYGSDFYLSRVVQNVGKINNDPFIPIWDAKKAIAKSQWSSDVADWEDTGKWMYIGARVTRIRATASRYDWEFLYSDEGWNVQHGVALDLYEDFDVNSLFDGMALTEDELNWRLRGS